MGLLKGYIGAIEPVAGKLKYKLNPACTKYIEPFIGGGGLLSCIPAGSYEREIINDKNVALANMYDLLANPDTCEEARNVLESIEKPDNEEEARKQYKEAIQFARKYIEKCTCISDHIEFREIGGLEERMKLLKAAYIKYTQSFNCGGQSYRKFGDNAKYQCSVKRNVDETIRKLQGVQVMSTFSGNVIKDYIDDEQVQLMLDPPFVGMYRRSQKLYDVEMPDLYHHISLAKYIAKAKASILLLGYRAPDGLPTIYDAILSRQYNWRCYLVDQRSGPEVCKKGEKKYKNSLYVWTNTTPQTRDAWFASQIDYKDELNEVDFWNLIAEHILQGDIKNMALLDYMDAFDNCKNKYKKLLSGTVMETKVMREPEFCYKRYVLKRKREEGCTS